MAQRQKNAHQGIAILQTGCSTCCQLPAAAVFIWVQAALIKFLVT